MEKQTVFIKRYPKNGELPKASQYVFVNNGKGRLDAGELYFNGSDLIFNNRGRRLVNQTKYWLEEVEIIGSTHTQDGGQEG